MIEKQMDGLMLVIARHLMTVMDGGVVRSTGKIHSKNDKLTDEQIGRQMDTVDDWMDRCKDGCLDRLVNGQMDEEVIQILWMDELICRQSERCLTGWKHIRIDECFHLSPSQET